MTPCEARVHRLAARGFGATADVYDRARSAYPPAAVEALQRVLDLAPGRTLADVGAGTGKLTRQLRSSGARIVAVEPVAGMRLRLQALTPAVQVLAATAEALPLRTGSIDALVAGQAFHWFDGPAALAEWHRVLRPGGRIGLIWNLRDESVDWVRRLTAIIDPYTADAPRYHRGEWRQAFERTDAFRPLRHRAFRSLQPTTPELVVQRMASVSFIAALDESTRRVVLDEVRALLGTHPATRDREQLTLPQVADVYWAERR